MIPLLTVPEIFFPVKSSARWIFGMRPRANLAIWFGHKTFVLIFVVEGRN